MGLAPTAGQSKSGVHLASRSPSQPSHKFLVLSCLLDAVMAPALPGLGSTWLYMVPLVCFLGWYLCARHSDCRTGCAKGEAPQDN